MLQLHLELLVRIFVGTLLGGAIGYERDLHGRPAGLRTHAIVALASATFMVVSTRFVYFQHYTKDDLVAIDPSRIAASVVSGIGFLGAGAILRDGITIRGLTTAAGLWLVAAIGMASGGGMYVESVFATVLGLAALTLLRRFEDRGLKLTRRRLWLAVDPAGTSIPAVIDRLTKLGGILKQEEYERQAAGGQASATFELQLPTTFDLQTLVDALERDEAVRAVRIQQL
ncbi:MAG TPA: MgtC/SapB family protein [Polyangia bacterium]|nr:MgtC/SapB family protein [Polyangia bacterium]